MTLQTENIAGYEVDKLSINACVEDVVEWITGRRTSEFPNRCRWLACMNPHSYAVSLKDSEFSKALNAADWLVPDGAGIVLASKILGGEIAERVTGSDIFKGVLEALDRDGDCSVFFLGATEQTLHAIRLRIAVDYPNVRIAGTYSPPFKLEYTRDELDSMVAAINDVAPDVLWVGMTAPKQEKWINAECGRLNVRFAAAIGAVFDFYTGQVKRSHPIFQRLGLEWLPRLAQEPRRLWRRMFISAPIFLWYVLREKMRKSV